MNRPTEVVKIHLHYYDDDRCRMGHQMFNLSDYASDEVAARLIVNMALSSRHAWSRPVTFLQVEALDEVGNVVAQTFLHLQKVFTSHNGLAELLLNLIPKENVA